MNDPYKRDNFGCFLAFMLLLFATYVSILFSVVAYGFPLFFMCHNTIANMPGTFAFNSDEVFLCLLLRAFATPWLESSPSVPNPQKNERKHYLARQKETNHFAATTHGEPQEFPHFSPDIAIIAQGDSEACSVQNIYVEGSNSVHDHHPSPSITTNHHPSPSMTIQEQAKTEGA